MVSPLRFFQLAQKLIQLFLAGEGDAVDALQHLAMFVAAPVRARRAEELDGFDQPGARQVRTAARWPVLPPGTTASRPEPAGGRTNASRLPALRAVRRSAAPRARRGRVWSPGRAVPHPL